MRFTKKDLIKLLDSYGRAYYNPSLKGKSKHNFLKLIQLESFKAATVEELSEKFDFLYKKYKAFKSGSEAKFEYFTNVDKAVRLALQDFMPKETHVEVLSEDEDYIPEEVTIAEKPKVDTIKRSHDEDLIQTVEKKVKFDDSCNAIQNSSVPLNIPIVPQNTEIQCVKIDDSVLKCIEINVTNAVLESLKKHDEEKAQSLIEIKNQLRSTIQNCTTEIIQTMHKKDKENRLSDVFVMMKTLLDEQREANEILVEIKTILKSSIAGQKVQYDVDTKRYDMEKNNENLLKEVLSIIRDNNST